MLAADIDPGTPGELTLVMTKFGNPAVTIGYQITVE